MKTFGYTAYAVDGTRSATTDTVSAVDKKEAEKLIKARYNYPVRIVFFENMIAPELDTIR